jgi:hypothetical protein
MKLLKVKAEDGVIHNIHVHLVIDYVEEDVATTKLILGYPMEDQTFIVPWNADELIEEIYGIDDTDDVYEVIDCTPLPPLKFEFSLGTSLPNSLIKGIDITQSFIIDPDLPNKRRRTGRKGKGNT